MPTLTVMNSAVKLYCSHNDFIADWHKLQETADALQHIICGETAGEKEVSIGHTYLEGGKTISEYPCDGFSIVYNTSHLK